MKRVSLVSGFIVLVALALSVFVMPIYGASTSDIVRISSSDELADALRNAEDGVVIQLTNDIKHKRAIGVSSSITIDLNGHELHIFTDVENMTAVWVYGGGIQLVGEGEFNVTSVYGDGVFVSGDASIEVNNIISRGTAGVHASDDSVVIVHGDITGNEWLGIRAADNASVTVYGNVEGKNMAIRATDSSTVYIVGNIADADTEVAGVMAIGEGTAVTIRGDVYGGMGLVAEYGAIINVYGRVTGTNGFGLRASTTATITVHGDVVSAMATHGGIVNIYGDVSANDLGSGVSVHGEGAIITVHGNIATDDSTGVNAFEGGIANIYGDISANGLSPAVSVGEDAIVNVQGNILAGNVSARYGGAAIVWGDGISENVIIGGVTARDGGTVIAHGNVLGYGVRARHEGVVRVYGDVYGEFDGINARYGSDVHVAGNVTGGFRGISADHENTTVTVVGNVQGSTAIQANRGAVVDITGDVIGERIGINALFGADVTVRGDVSGQWWGIKVSTGNTTITVYGEITAAPDGLAISYVDAIYLFAFLVAIIDIDIYDDDIGIYIIAFFATFTSFSSRTMADYDSIENDYLVFDLWGDIVRIGQLEDAAR